jgi:hypothetical protein
MISEQTFALGLSYAMDCSPVLLLSQVGYIYQPLKVLLAAPFAAMAVLGYVLGLTVHMAVFSCVQLVLPCVAGSGVVEALSKLAGPDATRTMEQLLLTANMPLTGALVTSVCVSWAPLVILVAIGAGYAHTKLKKQHID